MGVANYRFMPASGGPQDVGTVTILRGSNFEPNSPPPDVNGIWEGTYTSTVPGGTGPLSLLIMQDQTSTGAPAGISYSGMLSVVIQGGTTIDLAVQASH